MIRRAALSALLLLAAMPAHADFHSLVRAVSSRSGAHRISMPFLGLARVAVWMIRPAGISDFQLATFEGRVSIRPAEADVLMRRNLPPGFRPVVRVESTRKGEMTLIYAREKGNEFEVFLFAVDDSEAVVLRAEVDPEVFAREVVEKREIRFARGD